MINEAKEKIQKEAFEALEANNFNGFLQIGTGLGKSKILVEVIKALRPINCLYLCDSTLNRDETFKDELVKWGAGEWTELIDFQCYQTAYKYEERHYDLVICDEADFALTPEYAKFFKNNSWDHIVMCSGSLEADKKKMLKGIAPIVYTCDIKEMEESGAVNKANYFLVNYKLSVPENKTYLDFNASFARMLNGESTNTWALNQLKIRRKQFMSKLDSSYQVANKLVKEIKHDYPGEKILIFTGLTEQADKFKYSYHGKNDKENNLKKFHEGEIDEMAVVSKINRGKNIDGIRHTILESVPSSNTKAIQQTGRGRRLDTDEYGNTYFLVPYYTTLRGELKPTIVGTWVSNHTEKLNITNVTTYKFTS